MTAHTQSTPGPWHVTASERLKNAQTGELEMVTYVSSESHGYVPIRTPFREGAFEGENRSDHPESEVAANIRLIAAAYLLPEIRETLRLLAASHDQLVTIIVSNPEANPLWSRPMAVEHRRRFDNALALLAKLEQHLETGGES